MTVVLKGSSVSQTNLIRTYSASSTNEGFIEWNGGVTNGSRLEDVGVYAGDGTLMAAC
jgi:hypothetical protein